MTKRQTSDGKSTFYVDCGKIKNKRIRIRFSNETEAVEYADKVYKERLNNGTKAVLDLRESVQHEVAFNLSRLKEYGAGLTEAVDFFLKFNKPADHSLTISKAVALWRKSKDLQGNRESGTAKTISSFYKPFLRHFGGEYVTSAIAPDQLDKYLNSHPETWSNLTFNNHHRNLTVLFNFLIKKGYCTLNPLAKIEKRKAAGSSTACLTPNQTKAALDYCLKNKKFNELALLVLTSFCGVRVEEARKLNWEDIDLTQGHIEVSAAIAKKTARRNNEIPLNAFYWLKKIPDRKGRVIPLTVEGLGSAITRLWNSVDFDYPQNALRHGFATYHLASFGSYEKTAILLGHPNGKQLYSTYREMTTRHTADEFWQILPDGTFEELREKYRLTLIKKLHSILKSIEEEGTFAGELVINEKTLQLLENYNGVEDVRADLSDEMAAFKMELVPRSLL